MSACQKSQESYKELFKRQQNNISKMLTGAGKQG
jgi:hypothetical protein